MSKKILLIVDNSDSDLKTINTIVKKAHICTKTAKCGKDALKIIEKNKITFVLTNIRMPEMTGYELRWEIQKKHPEICIGYASILPAKDANMDGAKVFIQKPFSPESLMAGIKKLMRKR